MLSDVDSASKKSMKLYLFELMDYVMCAKQFGTKFHSKTCVDMKCKNCIIVPHWGSATTQTRLSMVQLAIRNVLQAINNEKELESEVFE